MKTCVAIVGIAVACAALAVPAPADAQESSAAQRVEPFTHLTGPRVELGEATPGSSEMRRLCPQSSRRLHKYWEYTTYFVDKYTIPFRDKEILILRTAWLSRGDYIWGAALRQGQGVRADGRGDPAHHGRARGPRVERLRCDAAAGGRRAAHEPLRERRHVERAVGRYSEDQVREVVLIVGDYTQLAMFQNSLGAQLPEGYEGLPD